MSEVWFIRHGESISNANLQTTHPAESPLTPKGEAEAAMVPAAFEGRKPSLVVSSSYVRAQQTAVPTLNHFDPIPQEIWPVHEFTYLAPHRYNGTRMGDRMPFAMAYWKKQDPYHKDEEEGESFANCIGRVEQLVERLHNHEAPLIAIFSHGLFLRLLLLRLMLGYHEPSVELMQRSYHLIRAVEFPNCAICVTHFSSPEKVSFSNIRTDHLALAKDKHELDA